jgi:hypothetical protein
MNYKKTTAELDARVPKAEPPHVPICACCDAEIIGIGPGEGAWLVSVTAPHNRPAVTPFCGSCVVELAKLGVRLLPLPPVP